MNELDVGELNHGEKFPAKFLPYVTTEQYQGGSYDGQYRHLSVPELLDWSLWTHCANRKFSDWDPIMHIAGTRDVAIRKQTQFSWLVQITEDISSLFKAINWVQEKERKENVEENKWKMEGC
jgi:hypothetical protein